jgi:thiol-disulfide isomerase/thioredoxin
MRAHQLALGVVLAIAVGGAFVTLAHANERGEQMTGSTIRLGVEGSFPSLRSSTGWLNSQALTPAELRGKVVLVEFWTYSCINWLRTLPDVRAWADKYKDQGLVVVGVHTPEFEFEKSLDNIRRAVKDMRITNPTAIDSDYAIWRAFDTGLPSILSMLTDAFGPLSGS